MLAPAVLGGWGAAFATTTRAAAPTVDGTWKLTTKDCVFGCTKTFQLLDSGGVLTDPHDPDYYGSIAGRVMTITDTPAPGETWACSGNLNTTLTSLPKGRFTTISGTVSTVGTCQLNKRPPKKKPRRATRASLAASVNPVAKHKAVTFKVRVTPDPGGGTVKFTSVGSPLAGCGAAKVASSTGTASCKASFAAAGKHTVVATYAGDAKFSPSKPASVIERVTG